MDERTTDTYPHYEKWDDPYAYPHYEKWDDPCTYYTSEHGRAKMTLFEIETAIGQALNNLTVDEETGEVKGYEELEKLQADKQEKIENIGKYIINLGAEAKALEEQEKKFAKRKQSAKKKAEYLKGLLSLSLDGQAYKSTEIQISFRKSESLLIDDIGLIGDDYITYEPNVNKTALKAAIKAGEDIKGCHIETKNNIQVK